MSSECKKMEKCGFCCKAATSHENSQSCTGDFDMIRLNSALHELALLSNIAETRKRHTQDRSAAAKTVPSAAIPPAETAPPLPPRKGFCVLHMNSNYMTNFSGHTWKSPLASGYTNRAPCTENGAKHFKSRDCHQEPKRLSLMATARPHQGKFYGLRCRQRFDKPYEVPWMPKMEAYLAYVPESDSSSKDSGLGNRSNPGSPEKVPVESPSPLVRSRSLDDIESIHHPEAGASIGHKSELESMSQCMEDLHVN